MLSGKLSNPNTHTGPEFLSKLVRINKNKTVHMPTALRLRSVYASRFASSGEDIDYEVGVADDDDDDDEAESEDDE